jgi:hypothetical protein
VADAIVEQVAKNILASGGLTMQWFRVTGSSRYTEIARKEFAELGAVVVHDNSKRFWLRVAGSKEQFYDRARELGIALTYVTGLNPHYAKALCGKYVVKLGKHTPGCLECRALRVSDKQNKQVQGRRLPVRAVQRYKTNSQTESTLDGSLTSLKQLKNKAMDEAIKVIEECDALINEAENLEARIKAVTS